MKLKNMLYSLLLMTVLTFASCNETSIDLVPIGDTDATFFQNETQMTQAVLGIYQKVTFFYTFRNNQDLFLQSVWQLPSDDLTTQASHGMETFSGLTGQTVQLKDFYAYAYQLIARANVVLQKIEENGSLAYKMKPELKNYHKGEALFLRSWMNFILWNTYGTAPLINERILNMDEAYPSNSTGTQLLDQAISDLALAITLLPATWDAANKGRVTANSARALRGKALVFRGTASKIPADFTSALSDFNAIAGASLMPNYGDNFNYTKEYNAESFFEYSANEAAGGTNNNAALNNDGFAVVGDLSAWYGYFTQKPSWIGSTVYSATQSLIDSYESGDPRMTYTLKANPKGTDLINVVKYTKDGMTTTGKAANEQSKNNPRILRYADVLLLRAEATVRSGGNLKDAITIINQIRDRARKSVVSGPASATPIDRNVNETNSATVLNWIFQERRIELACEEGHRWYDLRRRHIAGEIDLKIWNFNSKRIDFAFKDYNVNFPLPEIETIDNKNLKQNTGY
jgi:hypothetical protein